MARRRTRIAAVVLALAPAVAAAQETLLDDPTFFRVYVYAATPTPPHVAVFVSGDGGWNQGVKDMSAVIAGLDTLVIGVDVRYWMRTLRNAETPCSDFAGDLAALAERVERRQGYRQSVPAWIAGYSSGATMVYAALVQAAPGTFRGAIGFGFCPDLAVIREPCAGRGLEWDPVARGRGVVFRTSKLPEQPFVAFQGDIDQVCKPAETRAFVAATAHGEIVELDRVGHGFAVLKNWRGQFEAEFRRLQRGERGPG
jgi:predicted esterase